MKCSLTGKIFPVLDEALVIECGRLATGAHIHEANTLIGLYRASVTNVLRLAEIVAETGVKPGDVEEMERRLAFVDKFERTLRAFVVQQRLAAAPPRSS